MPFNKRLIGLPSLFSSFSKTFDLIIACIASSNKSEQVFKGDWEFEGKRKIFPQKIFLFPSRNIYN